MNSLTSEHGVQLEWTRLPACLCQSQEKKGETREKERGELSSSRCSLATEKRQKRTIQFKASQSPLFCFHLIFSSHLRGRCKSLEHQSCCKATSTMGSRAVKWEEKKKQSEGDKDQVYLGKGSSWRKPHNFWMWLLCNQALIAACKLFLFS